MASSLELEMSYLLRSSGTAHCLHTKDQLRLAHAEKFMVSLHLLPLPGRVSRVVPIFHTRLQAHVRLAVEGMYCSAMSRKEFAGKSEQIESFRNAIRSMARHKLRTSPLLVIVEGAEVY